MIEVVVSENGRLLDRLEFDADTVVQHKGDVVALHRGSMRLCSGSDGLWHRVAHASSYLAGTEHLKRTFRQLETFVTARGHSPSPSRGEVLQVVPAPPTIEVEDDDLYRLQRDSHEGEADYLARGCSAATGKVSFDCRVEPEDGWEHPNQYAECHVDLPVRFETNAPSPLRHDGSIRGYSDFRVESRSELDRVSETGTLRARG